MLQKHLLFDLVSVKRMELGSDLLTSEEGQSYLGHCPSSDRIFPFFNAASYSILVSVCFVPGILLGLGVSCEQDSCVPASETLQSSKESKVTRGGTGTACVGKGKRRF